MYLELRADGRNLLGTVISYGEVAQPGGFSERFLPGSLSLEDVTLNYMHNKERLLARTPDTLQLFDSNETLEMRAQLPKTKEADDTLELMRSGVLKGLSVGFAAIEEERDEQNIRVIKKAYLDHIAVVDKPAYHNSKVEPRRIWALPLEIKLPKEKKHIVDNMPSRNWSYRWI